MFRFLGFLVGSAASVGFLAWLLGIPRLETGTVPAPEPSVGEEFRDEPPAATAVAASVPGEPAETETVTTGAAQRPGPGDEPPVALLPEAAHAGVPADPDLHWHTFWEPFRSEIAARGFVTRLERVTGLDYRIVKVQNGVYEVSFAYGSDAELDGMLSRIHAATGLDLRAE